MTSRRKSGGPEASSTGNGGETHQSASTPETRLTTNHGVPIGDNQNSLKAGPRGPSLLEDFALREKIQHFDHERIPERVVHARGSLRRMAYFELYEDLARRIHVSARVLTDTSASRREVFVRFLHGRRIGAGSVDTPRDVRGFAVKLYTEEGKLGSRRQQHPGLLHPGCDQVPGPDPCGQAGGPTTRYPQAASAHDTFWDFISPDARKHAHMLMWVMSDRAHAAQPGA